MAFVDVPQAADQNISESKKIIKRCSSGRPLSMTRIDTEVFILCYDSEHRVPTTVPAWSTGNHCFPNSNISPRIRSVRGQTRSTATRPRDHRVGRPSGTSFVPVPLRPPVLHRVRGSQEPAHGTPNPDHPSRLRRYRNRRRGNDTVLVGRERRGSEFRLRSGFRWGLVS